MKNSVCAIVHIASFETDFLLSICRVSFQVLKLQLVSGQFRRTLLVSECPGESHHPLAPLGSESHTLGIATLQM